jgi:hypothetical protein
MRKSGKDGISLPVQANEGQKQLWRGKQQGH